MLKHIFYVVDEKRKKSTNFCVQECKIFLKKFFQTQTYCYNIRRGLNLNENTCFLAQSNSNYRIKHKFKLMNESEVGHATLISTN